MKLNIGTYVLVEPNSGPMGGHEFQARITDIVGGEYIVEDQDSDFFTVSESEVSEIKD